MKYISVFSKKPLFLSTMRANPIVKNPFWEIKQSSESTKHIFIQDSIFSSVKLRKMFIFLVLIFFPWNFFKLGNFKRYLFLDPNKYSFYSSILHQGVNANSLQIIKIKNLPTVHNILQIVQYMPYLKDWWLSLKSSIRYLEIKYKIS